MTIHVMYRNMNAKKMNASNKEKEDDPIHGIDLGELVVMSNDETEDTLIRFCVSK